MGASLPKPDLSMRHHSPNSRMAKAGLPDPLQSMQVQAGPLAWSEVLKDGLIEACGSLKAAALTMEIDPSQLSRDLPAGTFQIKRLEKLDATQRAIVVRTLCAAFLELMDPKAYALSLIDSAEKDLKELRQYINEEKAS